MRQGLDSLGMKKTVAFYTLGCRVNQYETQALREKMAGLGFLPAADGEPADVYIINTCAVTAVSDRKSRQLIRRARRENPDGIVAVIGCYAQTRPEEATAMPQADIVLGSGDKSRLPELIAGYAAGRGRIAEVSSFEASAGYDSLGAVTSMESRTRAYIKIEDGCDRFCAFCVIPYARGPVRSRPAGEIVGEAERLLARGHKELVLTGINLALYGSERTGGGAYGLHDVVGQIDRLGGRFRIRLGSLEPTVINEDYIKRLLVYERLCPSMHLSLQSGSTRILKEMGRSYTHDGYMGLVRLLRAHDAGYGLSTDIIVGFPGEDDGDFGESLAMVKEAGFLHTHVFPYSKREGTRAAAMGGQIPAGAKSERSRRLIAEAEAASWAFIDSEIGRARTVLVERRDQAAGISEGLSENNIRVFFQGCEVPEGDFAEVRICARAEGGALGELCPGQGPG
ncbi:MAG: tRNA (N(6)-L-threonylcarbamoyladenosine(37)-C(2))-methylthiotransferase MtaB [Clostridiales Family XIII bacterium]|jgi:threonylcarbamoyladenosine tRNA methylthiotransferase MtaB|nr:tRNA (N(6)-L-threonylcarbamoyladenosine(37)-C(2))-methylthiotransferase MtaB [Clostridiales Family XIII bacterium]